MKHHDWVFHSKCVFQSDGTSESIWACRACGEKIIHPMRPSYHQDRFTCDENIIRQVHES